MALWYLLRMPETHAFKNPETGTVLNDFSAALKPLPPGIVPSAEKGIAPLTTRDYRVDDPMNQAAVDTLLYDIVCQERATMATGAKLYVVIGENHAMPSHKMTQAGLLDNLTADRDTHGSVMLALETPYNYWQQYLDTHYNILVPKPLKKSFHDRDPLGHHFARAVLAKNEYPYAPQSKTRVLSRALSHSLPIALCDAALDGSFLDPVDDLAREIAQSKRFQCDLRNEKIPITPITGDTRGVNIRNAVMARRAVETAQAKHVKADTIVMQTGRGHLGGNMLDGLDYETSLTALLKDQIRPQDRVLSVFFSSAVDNYTPERIVPPEMWEDNPDHIIIRNLCDEFYLYARQNDENGCIKRLGLSYQSTAFGGNVPDRFGLPDLPSAKSVTKQIDQIISGLTP